MERRVIPGSIDTVFEFDYSVQAEDMRGLYEKAKRDQWNASRDIAWDDAGHRRRARALRRADRHLRQSHLGAPQRARPRRAEPADRGLAAVRARVRRAGRHARRAVRSSTSSPAPDQKFFQATQVVDEARHNEVLERYLETRLDGLHYPMPENERVLFDSHPHGPSLVRQDDRAPARGGDVRRVHVQDDGRGGGGPGAPRGLPAHPPGRVPPHGLRHARPARRSCARRATAERHEMEDFTRATALEKVLTGFFPMEAYRDVGFSRAQIDEVRRHRREVAAQNDYAVYRKYFRRDMHASMVSNLARIGLLTERVRPRMAVARHRAARRGVASRPSVELHRDRNIGRSRILASPNADPRVCPTRSSLPPRPPNTDPNVGRRVTGRGWGRPLRDTLLRQAVRLDGRATELSTPSSVRRRRHGPGESARTSPFPLVLARPIRSGEQCTSDQVDTPLPIR